MSRTLNEDAELADRTIEEVSARVVARLTERGHEVGHKKAGCVSALIKAHIDGTFVWLIFRKQRKGGSVRANGKVTAYISWDPLVHGAHRMPQRNNLDGWADALVVQLEREAHVKNREQTKLDNRRRELLAVESIVDHLKSTSPAGVRVEPAAADGPITKVRIRVSFDQQLNFESAEVFMAELDGLRKKYR